MSPRALSSAATPFVRLRFLWGGGGDGAPGREEEREAALESLGGGRWRLAVRKEDLPADADFMEVLAPFFAARTGDAGWWMHGRGVYGRFDRDEGEFVDDTQLTPVFAVKRGGALWSARVRSWRFDYDFVVRARGGAWQVLPRFRLAAVREFFPYYQDVVVDFARHDGEGADYNDVARAYRDERIAAGELRPIKERECEHPELSYLCDAIVVRIQTHASKEIPDEDAPTLDFAPGGEPPVVVHFPFDVAAEFMQALKDAGVDKLSFCSAGWQDGGYDGRVPGHFPVCAEAGGEAGFARLVAKARELGYQLSLHATNTDGYTCSPRWDEEWTCKDARGAPLLGGVWSGGRCHFVCQERAWRGWIPGEMEKMAALGVRGPHYIDVYGAMYPVRCADPRHPCTPERTAQIQNEVLARARELFGGAASEAGYDHVVGNVDYVNYVLRDLKRLADGDHSPLVAGVFPFWELVHHGIVLYTPDRLCQNHTRGASRYKLEKSGDPRWMEGDGNEDPRVALKIVEFGGRPVFYTCKFADVPRIKKAWEEFAPVRHLQRELMDGHREVAPDVFETRYADGSRTVCNYREEPFEEGGAQIPALGYALFGPDGRLAFSRKAVEG